MKLNFIFTLLLFFICINATIINVPADQPTIQTGINVTVDGDTVLVQPGTYIENINYIGKNITVASLYLTTQDTSYISQTIIDGNQISSVVKFESGEDSTAVLTGFTITNGNTYNGGGIYCYQSSPDINNVTITYNDAMLGGGIYCEESNPRLDNVTISYNDTGWGFGPAGGGICCLQSTLTLENVTINGNISTAGGGIYCYQSSSDINNVTITNNFAELGSGIWCSNSSMSMVNVTISDNLADGIGGGVAFDTSNPSLFNVTISGNSAYDGGGIWCAESNPILTNVIINDNTANWGAGIYCYDNSSAILNNVVIFNNTALYEGGGILNDNCNLNLTNSTITMNSAPLGTGIFCSGNSNLNILNSILWNNQPQGMYISGGTIISIYYSNYQGAGGYFGNIDEDPLFVGTGEDPYSLLENSPCIDTGIPDTLGLNLPPWDIIGNHRIWDGDGDGTAIIDMGAYEYDALPYVDIKDNVIVYTSEVFLHQNYPNPFNPSTTISFVIPDESKVELSIYNIKGQKIKTLFCDQLSLGQHSVMWDGRDDSNKPVSSGIYLYKLQTQTMTQTRKMLLLK